MPRAGGPRGLIGAQMPFKLFACLFGPSAPAPSTREAEQGAPRSEGPSSQRQRRDGAVAAPSSTGASIAIFSLSAPGAGTLNGITCSNRGFVAVSGHEVAQRQERGEVVLVLLEVVRLPVMFNDYVHHLAALASFDPLFGSALQCMSQLLSLPTGRDRSTSIEVSVPPRWPGVLSSNLQLCTRPAAQFGLALGPRAHVLVIEHLPLLAGLRGSITAANPPLRMSSGEVVPPHPDNSVSNTPPVVLATMQQTTRVSAAVQRAHLMMSEVPALLTLLTQHGVVLSQNELSVAYFSNIEGVDICRHTPNTQVSTLVSSNPAAEVNPEDAVMSSLRSGLLPLLFALEDPDALEEMLEDVLIMGLAWRRIMRVPASLVNDGVFQTQGTAVSGQLGRRTSTSTTTPHSSVPIVSTSGRPSYAGGPNSNAGPHGINVPSYPGVYTSVQGGMGALGSTMGALGSTRSSAQVGHHLPPRPHGSSNRGPMSSSDDTGMGTWAGNTSEDGAGWRSRASGTQRTTPMLSLRPTALAAAAAEAAALVTSGLAGSNERAPGGSSMRVPSERVSNADGYASTAHPDGKLPLGSGMGHKSQSARGLDSEVDLVHELLLGSGRTSANNSQPLDPNARRVTSHEVAMGAAHTAGHSSNSGLVYSIQQGSVSVPGTSRVTAAASTKGCAQGEVAADRSSAPTQGNGSKTDPTVGTGSPVQQRSVAGRQNSLRARGSHGAYPGVAGDSTDATPGHSSGQVDLESGPVTSTGAGGMATRPSLLGQQAVQDHVSSGRALGGKGVNGEVVSAHDVLHTASRNGDPGDGPLSGVTPSGISMRAGRSGRHLHGGALTTGTRLNALLMQAASSGSSFSTGQLAPSRSGLSMAQLTHLQLTQGGPSSRDTSGANLHLPGSGNLFINQHPPATASRSNTDDILQARGAVLRSALGAAAVAPGSPASGTSAGSGLLQHPPTTSTSRQVGTDRQAADSGAAGVAGTSQSFTAPSPPAQNMRTLRAWESAKSRLTTTEVGSRTASRPGSSVVANPPSSGTSAALQQAVGEHPTAGPRAVAAATAPASVHAKTEAAAAAALAAFEGETSTPGTRTNMSLEVAEQIREVTSRAATSSQRQVLSPKAGAQGWRMLPLSEAAVGQGSSARTSNQSGSGSNAGRTSRGDSVRSSEHPGMSAIEAAAQRNMARQPVRKVLSLLNVVDSSGPRPPSSPEALAPVRQARTSGPQMQQVHAAFEMDGLHTQGSPLMSTLEALHEGQSESLAQTGPNRAHPDITVVPRTSSAAAHESWLDPMLAAAQVQSSAASRGGTPLSTGPQRLPVNPSPSHSRLLRPSVDLNNPPPPAAAEPAESAAAGADEHGMHQGLYKQPSRFSYVSDAAGMQGAQAVARGGKDGTAAAAAAAPEPSRSVEAYTAGSAPAGERAGEEYGAVMGREEAEEEGVEDSEGKQMQMEVGGEGEGEVFEEEEEVAWCWHEVEIKPVVDPVTKEAALLLVQRDVTERAQLENTLSELTEAQLAMLSQIFPRHVIEALSMGENITVDKIAKLARSHVDVSILFMDIVGFTAMSKDVPAEEVIVFLNYLFSRFDRLVERHGVQKIDTIGDAFIVASGILAPDAEGFKAVDEDHDPAEGAARVIGFAIDMLRVSFPVRMPNGQLVALRIGVHTGPCVSGLVGLGVPKWSVFGDTVNTAARLEQTCPFQHIQISEATADLLPKELRGFTPTGGVEMKGKGVLQTYIWAPPADWAVAAENGITPAPLPTVQMLKSYSMERPSAQQRQGSVPLPPMLTGAEGEGAAFMGVDGMAPAPCAPNVMMVSTTNEQIVLEGDVSSGGASPITLRDTGGMLSSTGGANALPLPTIHGTASSSSISVPPSVSTLAAGNSLTGAAPWPSSQNAGGGPSSSSLLWRRQAGRSPIAVDVGEGGASEQADFLVAAGLSPALLHGVRTASTTLSPLTGQTVSSTEVQEPGTVGSTAALEAQQEQSRRLVLLPASGALPTLLQHAAGLSAGGALLSPGMGGHHSAQRLPPPLIQLLVDTGASPTQSPAGSYTTVSVGTPVTPTGGHMMSIPSRPPRSFAPFSVTRSSPITSPGSPTASSLGGQTSGGAGSAPDQPSQPQARTRVKFAEGVVSPAGQDPAHRTSTFGSSAASGAGVGQDRSGPLPRAAVPRVRRLSVRRPGDGACSPVAEVTEGPSHGGSRHLHPREGSTGFSAMSQLAAHASQLLSAGAFASVPGRMGGLGSLDDRVMGGSRGNLGPGSGSLQGPRRVSAAGTSGAVGGMTAAMAAAFEPGSYSSSSNVYARRHSSALCLVQALGTAPLEEGDGEEGAATGEEWQKYGAPSVRTQVGNTGFGGRAAGPGVVGTPPRSGRVMGGDRAGSPVTSPPAALHPPHRWSLAGQQALLAGERSSGNPNARPNSRNLTIALPQTPTAPGQATLGTARMLAGRAAAGPGPDLHGSGGFGSGASSAATPDAHMSVGDGDRSSNTAPTPATAGAAAANRYYNQHRLQLEEELRALQGGLGAHGTDATATSAMRFLLQNSSRKSGAAATLGGFVQQVTQTGGDRGMNAFSVGQAEGARGTSHSVARVGGGAVLMPATSALSNLTFLAHSAVGGQPGPGGAGIPAILLDSSSTPAHTAVVAEAQGEQVCSVARRPVRASKTERQLRRLSNGQAPEGTQQDISPGQLSGNVLAEEREGSFTQRSSAVRKRLSPSPTFVFTNPSATPTVRPPRATPSQTNLRVLTGAVSGVADEGCVSGGPTPTLAATDQQRAGSDSAIPLGEPLRPTESSTGASRHIFSVNSGSLTRSVGALHMAHVLGGATGGSATTSPPENSVTGSIPTTVQPGATPGTGSGQKAAARLRTGVLPRPVAGPVQSMDPMGAASTKGEVASHGAHLDPQVSPTKATAGLSATDKAV